MVTRCSIIRIMHRMAWLNPCCRAVASVRAGHGGLLAVPAGLPAARAPVLRRQARRLRHMQLPHGRPVLPLPAPRFLLLICSLSLPSLWLGPHRLQTPSGTCSGCFRYYCYCYSLSSLLLMILISDMPVTPGGVEPECGGTSGRHLREPLQQVADLDADWHCGAVWAVHVLLEGIWRHSLPKAFWLSYCMLLSVSLLSPNPSSCSHGVKFIPRFFFFFFVAYQWHCVDTM